MKIQELFKTLPEVSPQATLSETIFTRIHILERKQARVRCFSMFGVAFASTAVVIPSLIFIGQNLAASGAYQYLSLLMSDGGQIGNYWKELSMSIIESFPVFGAIALLSAVALFIWSIGKALRDAPAALQPKIN